MSNDSLLVNLSNKLTNKLSEQPNIAMRCSGKLILGEMANKNKVVVKITHGYDDN